MEDKKTFIKVNLAKLSVCLQFLSWCCHSDEDLEEIITDRPGQNGKEISGRNSAGPQKSEIGRTRMT